MLFLLMRPTSSSSRLLQKWDMFFKPNVIKEAKPLASSPELTKLLLSAETPEESDPDVYSSVALCPCQT